MKKVLILMILCLLCFGCGGKEEKNPETNNDVKNIVEIPEDESSEEDPNKTFVMPEFSTGG